MKNTFIITLLALGISFGNVVQGANTKKGAGQNNAPQSVNAAECQKASARVELNVNNVRTLVWNDGTMWWDHNSTARYEVPKNLDNNATKKNSMFAGGIWIGGQERNSGTQYIMAMTYATGGEAMYFAGPIDTIVATTNLSRCNKWDQIWEVEKSVVQKFALDYQAGLIKSRADVPEQILYWPGYKNQYLQTRAGTQKMDILDVSYRTARFVELYKKDGIYNPLDGDYPQLPGDLGRNIEDIDASADQSLFFVNNDVSGNKRVNNTTTVPTIGMEIHSEAFAYASADPRNDMTFYRNKLINKGSVYLDECYFAQYCDPDLGYSADDFVGCDVPRGLAICYNGDDFDETLLGYGENPPSIAVDYFIGPQADANDGLDNNKNGVIDEEGEKIIMSNFMTYDIGGNPVNGDPNSVADFYNYLRSKWRATPQGNSRDISYDLVNGQTPVGTFSSKLGGICQAAKFMYPDTSDRRICWGQGGTTRNPCPNGALPSWSEDQVPNTPGDRRFLSSAGPFTLEPGAVNQLTIGVVWARATAGGRKGSFAKLLVNDDIAQRLFDNDFVGVNGPNEPKVSISELDGQLILTLTPDTTNKNTGRNTENYTVRDGSLNPRNGDTLYRFQGYMVYQLADATVSTTELDNPDRARLIAQSDVRDDVGNIVNTAFDPELGAPASKVMVRGANTGIRRVVNVTNDAFNSNNGLINFKPYYFRVIAYAYNNNPDNLGQRFLISTPRKTLISGKTSSITVVTAIPHKVDVEKGGSIVRSRFDLGKNITRITGTGNGGNVLDSLVGKQYDTIATSMDLSRKLVYGGSTSPIAVKVFNPKKVKGGSFRVEVSSRIRMKRTGTYVPVAGDIIVSQLNSSGPNTNLSKISNTLPQKAGRAIVNSVDTLGNDVYDLNVSMYNDDEGGRFTKVIESFVQVSPSDFRFSDYTEEITAFNKEGDVTAAANATLYRSADYWKMTEVNTGKVVKNQYLISEAQEQLLPAYGISIVVSDKANPGELYQINNLVGLQRGSISYVDENNTWLEDQLSVSRPSTNGDYINKWTVSAPGPGDPISSGYNNWIAVDKQSKYLSIIGNSWAPYQACETASNGGPKSSVDLNKTAELAILGNLNRLHNVDIVMTKDTALWSRVPVLQLADQTIGIGQQAEISAYKSPVGSLNKNGQPSGEASPFGTAASTGMGWFPGYALDLDRGIRLNLMFSEDVNFTDEAVTTALKAPGFGNDLKYQFSRFTTQFLNNQFYIPTKHYIYVTDIPYDKGRSLENSFDSIANTRNSARGYQLSYTSLMNSVMWVGNPAIAFNQDSLATAAIVKLRIDRKLTSYPKRGGDTLTTPVYSFNSDGLETVVNNEGAAKSALDLIRVVPNPYYAYSSYESDKVDNRVLITNLPSKCKVSIYALNGTLVRQYSIDRSAITTENEQTYQDWDLKNQDGLPISSGFYLIHIDAGSLGERTVKFFGALRPLDLSGLSQN